MMGTQDLLQQKLADNEGKEFFVASMIGTQASKWVLYPSMKYEDTIFEREAETHKRITKKEIKTSNIPLSRFNLRQILPQEVIWDIDPPKTTEKRNQLEEAKKQGEKITKRLTEAGIAWEVHWTGNKGVHIQTVFNELRQYSDADRLFLKREIIKKYAWDCDYDLKTATSKCLIQLENTPHRKTLQNKQKWASFESEPRPIPEDVLTSYYVKKASETLRKGLKQEVREEVVGTLRELMDLPMCIKWVQDNKIQEGHRDQALFAMISHLKHKLHDRELQDAVEKWVCKHDDFLNPHEVTMKLNSALRTPAKTSCRFNKELLKDIGEIKLCEGCIHDTN